MRCEQSLVTGERHIYDIGSMSVVIAPTKIVIYMNSIFFDCGYVVWKRLNIPGSVAYRIHTVTVIRKRCSTYSKDANDNGHRPMLN